VATSVVTFELLNVGSPTQQRVRLCGYVGTKRKPSTLFMNQESSLMTIACSGPSALEEARYVKSNRVEYQPHSFYEISQSLFNLAICDSSCIGAVLVEVVEICLVPDHCNLAGISGGTKG
jgi:hypothetical protein